MYLALKEIKKEKLRFIMIILVTALIAYLVYFLASLAFGLAKLNRTAVDYWDASGIIVSKASNQNIYASSIELNNVEELGFREEDAINVSTSTVYINDGKERDMKPLDLVLIGYNINNINITPPIIEGREISNSNEITISSNFKDKVSIELEDTIEIANTGRVFRLVGFTKDSNYNTLPVGYVSQEKASQAMMLYTTGNSDIDASSSPTPNMPNRVSAVLVSNNQYGGIIDNSDFEFILTKDFIKTIPGYQAQVLTFGFMILALALISSIIIGIFMYILTMQKKSIFAVLKIQGYRDKYIMRSVLYQSIILVLVGFMLGLLLTIITVKFLPASVPVQLFWLLNLGATIFAFFSSTIGALFSARSILKIDPLEAL